MSSRSPKRGHFLRKPLQKINWLHQSVDLYTESKVFAMSSRSPKRDHFLRKVYWEQFCSGKVASQQLQITGKIIKKLQNFHYNLELECTLKLK